MQLGAVAGVPQMNAIGFVISRSDDFVIWAEGREINSWRRLQSEELLLRCRISDDPSLGRVVRLKGGRHHRLGMALQNSLDLCGGRVAQHDGLVEILGWRRGWGQFPGLQGS